MSPYVGAPYKSAYKLDGLTHITNNNQTSVHQLGRRVQCARMPSTDLEPNIEYILGLTIKNKIIIYSSQHKIRIHCHVSNLKRVRSDVWSKVRTFNIAFAI